MVKIEFNTADLTEGEARGLVALLLGIMGNGIVPASYERAGEVEYATGPVTINRVTMASLGMTEDPASDGYPSAGPVPGNYTTAPTSLREAQERSAVGTNVETSPDRDTAGIPWDERIHASTKTTNKDGTWTRRRNTPDEVFDAVMAELKGANTARTMEAAAPLVVPTPPPPPEPTAAEAFTPPANVVIPPAPVPVTTAAPTFVQIMQKVTGAQQAGKLDKAGLDGLLAQCDLDGVAKLVSANEGTRAAFDAVLSAHIA